MSSSPRAIRIRSVFHKTQSNLDPVGDRYWIMLLILSAVIVASPFVSLGAFYLLLMTSLLYGASALIRKDLRLTLILRLASLPFFVVLVMLISSPDRAGWVFERAPVIETILRVCSVALMVACSVALLVSLACVERVRGAHVAGATSLYLLIGFIWAQMYSLLEQVQPGSFTIPEWSDSFAANRPDTWVVHHRLFYFSFITLLTIGYGDISPTNSVASALVILQGVIGQMFVVIVLATVVTKRLEASKK